MRKIKQIAANLKSAGFTDIETPVNEFIETLPLKGDEIVDIKYATDNRGNIYYAVVMYNACVEVDENYDACGI